MWPLSWVHPEDESTISIEHQFYFGPALLVSPVVAENSTTATFYVPNEVYYDFFTLAPVQGEGAEIAVEDVGYETIPLHIRGGSIVPLRTGEANTTERNRDLPFHLVIAPNSTEQAWGYLRLDDGISLDPGDATSDIWMSFGNDTLEISGSFGYNESNIVDAIVFAGQTENRTISINDEPAANVIYDSGNQTLTAWGLGLTFGEMTVTLGDVQDDAGAGGSKTSTSEAPGPSESGSSAVASITGSVTTLEASATSAVASASGVASSVSEVLSSAIPSTSAPAL
jgi:hypothetical protein